MGDLDSKNSGSVDKERRLQEASINALKRSIRKRQALSAQYFTCDGPGPKPSLGVRFETNMAFNDLNGAISILLYNNFKQEDPKAYEACRLVFIKKVKQLFEEDMAVDNLSGGKERLSYMKEIEMEDYEKYRLVFVDKIRAVLDKKVSEWAKVDPKDLGKFDAHLRDLYALAVFDEVDPSINSEVLAVITKVEVEMNKFMDENPEKISVYVREFTEGLLSPRNQTLEKRLKDLEGKIPVSDLVVPEEVKRAFEEESLAKQKIMQSFLEASPMIKLEGNSYVVNYNGRKWGIKFYYMKDGNCLLTVSSAENPNLFVVLKKEVLLEKIVNNKFQDVVDEANFNYETERTKSGIVEKFDLPKDQPINYFAVFPETFDPVISASLQASAILSNVLRRRYPNLVANQPIFSGDPRTDLANAVESAYKGGCRYFYLDFYQHGTETNMAYEKTLTPADITAIVKKFPDAKFVVNTIACYGGGLRRGFAEQFMKDPSLKDRVSLFLQTKPDVPTLVGNALLFSDTVKSPDEIAVKNMGTYYLVFLISALLEGKTYGQAVLFADKMAKEYVKTDAEEIINGELITQNLAGSSDKKTAQA
ncbi:MAG: hypothetical protein WC285_02765 [Candidatus Gracilibacteria bacterium]